jgi:hypothetical protein
MTRAAFAAAAAVGLALAVVTLGWSQLSASRAGDELMDITSPVVTKRGVAQMRADIDRGTQLVGVTRTLGADVAKADPGFAASLAQLPAAVELGDKVVGNLERRQEQFEDAESLPGLGLSLHDAVLGQLVLAGLLVAAGLAGMLRPRRLLAGGVLAAGVALVAMPLALGHVGKAADTDELLDSLRPFSAAKVRAREQGLQAARTVFDGLRATGRAEPAVVAETTAALGRMDRLVTVSAKLQPLLVKADKLSATAGIIVILGAGGVLILAGAAGVARPPKRA